MLVKMHCLKHPDNSSVWLGSRGKGQDGELGGEGAQLWPHLHFWKTSVAASPEKTWRGAKLEAGRPLINQDGGYTINQDGGYTKRGLYVKGLLFSLKKEGNSDTGNHMEEPRRHHAKRHKVGHKRANAAQSPPKRYLERSHSEKVAWWLPGAVGGEEVSVINEDDFTLRRCREFWRLTVVMSVQQQECT